MSTMTLEQISSVTKGRIVLGNRKSNIHLPAKPMGSSANGSVVFLFRHINNEDKTLLWLRQHGVKCIITRSATGLSLSKWKRAGIAVIEVSNLTQAHIALAGAYRRQLNIPFIQVIGSAGKTTTKEMIGAVLKQSLNPLVGWKNDNLLPGIARNILRVNPKNGAAVVEAGMLGPGIIGSATKIIRPDIAVITSIQRAHMMRLGSMQNIIAAKAEILDYMSEESTLIINGEDDNIAQMPLHRFRGKLLTYGFSNRYDLWASNISYDGLKTNFTVHNKELEIDCVINIIGRYNVGNALAAFGVGLRLGLTPEQIRVGLAGFEPVEGRLKVHRANNGTIFIDDNFNANPDSTSLLIEELKHLSNFNRLILVLGDMERPAHSADSYARRVHFDVGQQLAGIPKVHVLAVGKWAREYVRGATSAGFPSDKIEYFPTIAEAKKRLRYLLTPGTVVVLKASVYTPVRRLMMGYLRPKTTGMSNRVQL